MTEDEQNILNFLNSSPDAYYARKEIARKAVKRTVFEENPRWADSPLNTLVDQNLVEKNDSGYYRIKSNDKYR